MGGHLYFTIFQVCMLVTAQAVNFTNTEIRDQSGLFYESIGKVQFTSSDWRLMSVIDITHLKSQKPSLSKDVLIHLNNTCNQLTMSNEVCKKILMTNILLQKSQQIEEDFNKVYDAISELSTGDLNVRCGFHGILNNTIFGSPAISETSVRHDDQVHKLESLEDAHYIHDQVDNLKIQSALNMKILNTTFDYFKKNQTTSDEVLNDIRIWVQSFEFELTSYIGFLKIVTEAIRLCGADIFHPELITVSMIKRGMEHNLIKNEMNRLVFATHADDEQIWNISKIDVGYYNGKLIGVIDIPLLDSTVYDLSKVQPYLVPQTFGYTRGSAYIQPKADYVLTSENSYTFTYGEELSACMQINNTYVCRYVRPIYDLKLQPSCESELVMLERQKQLKIFNNCNIQISSTFEPLWTQTNSGWLYSVPETEKLSIVCPEKWKQAISISGVGLLQMKKECYALTTSNLMIKGVQQSFQPMKEHMSPIMLNVTALLPTLKYLNFIPEQYTPLSVYQQKIKENLYYDHEEDLQKSLICLLIIGLIVVVFLLLLLPCVIKAKRRDVQLLTVRQTHL